jgi:hypothetical protein
MLVGKSAARSPSFRAEINNRAASLACLKPLPSPLHLMLNELSKITTAATGPPPAKSPAPV